MGGFMLDTNMVSALMRSPRGPVRQRISTVGPDNIWVSVITTGELFFGAEKTPTARGLDNFDQILSGLQVAPFQPPADRIYGRIRAALQQQGRPIGPNDLWIAAHALALDMTLITANVREFSRVPGLRFENWLD